MGGEKDYALREVGRLKLKLRSHLIFTPEQTAVGDAYYIIEDPINSKFHRIGYAEYVFASLLDGSTTIAEAMRLAAEASPNYALSEHSAAVICKWLVESDLAYTPESAQAARLAKKAQDVDQRTLLQRWNPISMRLRLFCPDRLFEAVQKSIGWMHAPGALALWCVTLAVGLYVIVSHWGRFVASSQGILASGNWFWLLVSGLCLKVVHELSHGIACKRYGGAVREVGIILILCVPLPYVDVTSCWKFRSKWQRIQTSAAGMYIELFIAAIAAMVWNATDPGILNQVCYNTILAASVTTIAINANPLMRFDGYYILSDLVEIPNLYSSGQEYLCNICRRYLLAVDAPSPIWSRSRAKLIVSYGVATLCWRIVICVSLVIAASALFRGAGLVLACLAVVLWVGLPTLKFARYLRGRGTERPSVPRLLATAGSASLLILLLAFMPWPGQISAPAIVEYDPMRIVRARSPGFLTFLKARSGSHVEQGQVIAVLENDQLELELAELEIAIRQSKVRCRSLEQARKMVAYQSEREHQGALLKRRIEKQTQVDELVIRAEISGNLFGRNLDSMLGTYLTEGSEVGSIGHEARKEIKVSVGESDVRVFSSWIGKPTEVRIGSLTRFASRLVKLDPQAKRQPPHPTLSASFGGPLAVRKKTIKSNSEGVSEERIELLAPRFVGSVQLHPKMARVLRAGQRGTVSIRPFHESIGSHLYNSVGRWIRDKIRFHTDA